MESYITAQQVSTGMLIDPINIIKIMSASEWETLTGEWLDIKEDYIRIENPGGAGDMGRDIIAYIEEPKINPENYAWDCYQCKHYSKSLMPSDIWQEFGKIIYYTFKKKYPIPKRYYFVAPLGIGTSLSDLLDNPKQLKISLKDNWEKYCKEKISEKESIPLAGNLLQYFDTFDFSIFDKIPPKQIVQEHKKHPNHSLRFGGGLPPRNRTTEIPPLETEIHLRYINQLKSAYNSDADEEIKEISKIELSKYKSHFQRARKSFYRAEELRAFTRDNLPFHVYEDFQNDILESIINLVEDELHTNAFIKLKEVENQASNTAIESNPVREVCQTIDKKGVCHQLVNDNKISWVEDEQ
jgi:hypothetical protein